MSEMFTKCNGFIVSGDPLVYADSATMTGQGTVSEPFGVKSTDLFVQEPLYTGTSGNSAYIGWRPDETVLWSGTALSATLSEPITNFERFKIKAANDQYFEFLGVDENHTIQFGNGNTNYLYFKMVNFKTNSTLLTTNQNMILNYGPWNGSSPTGFYYDKTSEPNWLKEVIGINRKV